MEKKDLQVLTNIYNALLNIETKGENTIIMGQCLYTLKDFVETKIQELDTQEEE